MPNFNSTNQAPNKVQLISGFPPFSEADHIQQYYGTGKGGENHAEFVNFGNEGQRQVTAQERACGGGEGMTDQPHSFTFHVKRDNPRYDLADCDEYKHVDHMHESVPQGRRCV